MTRAQRIAVAWYRRRRLRFMVALWIPCNVGIGDVLEADPGRIILVPEALRVYRTTRKLYTYKNKRVAEL